MKQKKRNAQVEKSKTPPKQKKKAKKKKCYAAVTALTDLLRAFCSSSEEYKTWYAKLEEYN